MEQFESNIKSSLPGLSRNPGVIYFILIFMSLFHLSLFYLSLVTLDLFLKLRLALLTSQLVLVDRGGSESQKICVDTCKRVYVCLYV